MYIAIGDIKLFFMLLALTVFLRKLLGRGGKWETGSDGNVKDFNSPVLDKPTPILGARNGDWFILLLMGVIVFGFAYLINKF